jgi:hypothetical protein
VLGVKDKCSKEKCAECGCLQLMRTVHRGPGWVVGTWQLICCRCTMLVNEILPYRSHAITRVMTCVFGDKTLYKRKSWGKSALLAPVLVSEFDATVADLRIVAGGLRVVIATTARREDLTFVLQRIDLGGEFEIVIELSVAVALVAAVRLVSSAGIVLAHRSSLLRVAVGVSQVVGRVCVAASRAGEQVLNVGARASVERTCETSIADVTTAVA